MQKQPLTLLIFYFIQLTIFAQWFWQNPLPQGNSLYDNHFETAEIGWAVAQEENVFKTADGRENRLSIFL